MESSEPPAANPDKINRREFLNYICAASAALLMAESGAGVLAYLTLFPVRKTVLHVDLSVLKHATYNSPVHIDPLIWLSNTSAGFFALQDVCTHRGCSLKWINVDQRFVCPCHQSEFFMDGSFLFGEAERNMDSYKVTVRTPDGIRTTPPQGGPVDISGATAIDVDLEVFIKGWPIGYSASGKPPTQNE